MILHRTTPPVPDPDGWLTVADGVRVNNGPPRRVDGCSIHALQCAFACTCVVIWGESAMRNLEHVCDIPPRSARDWLRRDQIPPPMVLGWIAYLNSFPDRQAIGYALLAMTREHSEKTWASAEIFFEGLRK